MARDISCGRGYDESMDSWETKLRYYPLETKATEVIAGDNRAITNLPMEEKTEFQFEISSGNEKTL